MKVAELIKKKFLGFYGATNQGNEEIVVYRILAKRYRKLLKTVAIIQTSIIGLSLQDHIMPTQSFIFFLYF